MSGNSDEIRCTVIYEEGFLIYEEMRKYLITYEGACWSYMTLNPIPSEFPLYMRKLLFFFISVGKYAQRR
jgi:hypothetical protein